MRTAYSCMDWCLTIFEFYPDDVLYDPCWERLKFIRDSKVHLDVGVREFEAMIDDYIATKRSRA